MLGHTKGIVLRSIKYGETSLICNIFTEVFGMQSYLIKGVRSTRSKTHKAALLQPASALDLIVYNNPNKSLQLIKEMQPAFIYTSLQEDVVKNSIALYSVEVLLRLLPEHAIMPELFHFVYEYLCSLDKAATRSIANFPIYYIIQCSRFLGYEIRGSYSKDTPYLNLTEGAYMRDISPGRLIEEADGIALSKLMGTKDIKQLEQVTLSAEQRYRLQEWFIEFLKVHSQHMGDIRSLAVLQQVLH